MIHEHINQLLSKIDGDCKVKVGITSFDSIQCSMNYVYNLSELYCVKAHLTFYHIFYCFYWIGILK